MMCGGDGLIFQRDLDARVSLQIYTQTEFVGSVSLLICLVLSSFPSL